MTQRRANPQMFALRRPPAEAIEVGGCRYRLLRVFKHDFFAATCLYEADGPAEVPKVVVKFGRRQGFCGLPLSWVARMARGREEAVYEALRGVAGVPRWVGRVGECGYAIEYVDARPLDHLPAPPAGFFDRLRDLFDAVHRRGVAYGDANKLSNILVGRSGEPYLVDFQIAIRLPESWPRPLRTIAGAVVEYLAGRDLYHLYKHKRRLSPQELRPQEEALSRRREGLHLLHRKLTKPYRALRRRFLRRQYRRGRLVSPTADLEDHHQPEKATWREPHQRPEHHERGQP